MGDITYLPLACGKNLYLATVIDCYSRKLAGWAVADHMRTDLIEAALLNAKGTRGSLAGAVFHADHGARYTSKAFAALCAGLGVIQSMGAVGSSADNALAESFNATLKREFLQGAATWLDELTCRREVFRWATRYNTPGGTPGAATCPRTTTKLCSRLRSAQPPNNHPACPRFRVKALPALVLSSSDIRVDAP